MFRTLADGREYLVIRSSRERAQIAPDTFVGAFWDFPKGKIEHGETAQQAAKREIEEETGISQFEFMPDFLRTVKYPIYQEEKPASKEVYMYLAQVESEIVLLSGEHSAFEWLLYDDAIRRVTIDGMKKVLQQASEFLENI